MPLLLVALLAGLGLPSATCRQGDPPQDPERITLKLPGYPWENVGQGFGLYRIHRSRTFEHLGGEREGDTATVRLPAGEPVWLMFGNRSSWVTLENLARVCGALSSVDDLGLDLTNRYVKDEELEAVARAHPRLRGLMISDRGPVPWALSRDAMRPLGPSLRALTLDVLSVPDETLALLIGPLVSLERITLSGPVGSATLAALSKLERLEGLDLRSSKGGAAEVLSLLRESRLRELRLRSVDKQRGWSQADWLELLAAAESLEGLGLHCTQLEGEVLERVLRLPALEWLEVYGSFFREPDRAAALVAAVTSRPWKGLQLSELAALDPEALRRIAAMPELSWLDLTGVEALEPDALVLLEKARSLRLLALPFDDRDYGKPIKGLLRANGDLVVLSGHETHR